MSRAALKSLLQPRYIIVAAIAVSIIAIAVTFFLESGLPSSGIAQAVEGPIVQEVNTTGTIEPAESVDLAFQSAGKIASVRVKVGDTVSPGETLATLGAADVAAQVEQAKAALAMQQANLDALKQGARPEDLAVSQTAVAGGQSALLQAKQTLISAVQNAYIQSDDAIHNRVDQFFVNPRSTNPTLALTLTDSQMQTNIESKRPSMELLLSNWQATIDALPQDSAMVDIAGLTRSATSNLNQLNTYLDQVALGLNQAIANPSYPPATIAGFKSSVATGRSGISAALSAVLSAQTAEKSAESSLAAAQSQLALKSAAATQTSLEAQEAQVASAQAMVDAAEANLAKSVLRAPIAGVITVNNAHLGQTVSPATPLISLNSNARFQVQSYVSQIDLAKIAVGNSAQISFDAYQNAPAVPAHVIAIDPAATVQNGVASYKVTLQFDTDDANEKAGLTTNIKITTAQKQNVIAVPTSAIITRGTQQYVMKQSAQEEVLTPIITGISSSDGKTEIVSGVAVGDTVRAFGNQQ